MTSPESRVDTLGEDAPPSDLVEVGAYRSADEGFQHGLVVLATGCPYWLMPAEHGHRLLVPSGAAEHVRDQLARFDRESLRWPPPPITDPWQGGPLALVTPLLWSAVILLIHDVSAKAPHLSAAGMLDAQAVIGRGEWWRAFTALFLHGSAAHVISNALSGILVFSAVVSTIGRLRGWLLVAVAGVVGNLAAAAINYPDTYRSVGASTAIFAGIGLLTGRALRVVARSDHPHRWRAMFVPLVAGLTVLALYGAGDVRVDVGAHLTGFLAGLACGFVAALPRLNRDTARR